MDRLSLVHVLQRIGERLNQNITLVAVGGTAMTLLELKNSTIDVDFTGPPHDIEEFKKAESIIKHGYDIDIWTMGDVHISQLPDDYIDKSILISESIEKIELRALHPLDIVVSKVARLIDRDREDIATCIAKWNLSEDEIRKRGKQVLDLYPGNEVAYQINLDDVIGCYCNKKTNNL
jgi:hypothetical protein